MKYKKYLIKGENIESISAILKRELKPSFEEVSKAQKTFLYIFEKYSLLQGSDMSGMLLIDVISDNECTINSIIAGGKTGFFRLDLFNMENSILHKTEDILIKICNDKSWHIKAISTTKI
jgi:hypothetical protein